MGKAELMHKLHSFKECCAAYGWPIKEITLEEAYPDVVVTSFIVRFSADGDWFVKTELRSSQILEKILEIFWESSDEETREAIFTISINDVKGAFHLENAA